MGSFKVENISIPGAELTKIHITVEIFNSESLNHINKHLILLTEN